MIKPNICIICEGTSDYTILNEIICDRMSLTRNCMALHPPLSRHMKGGWGFLWKFIKDNINTVGLVNYLKGAGSPIDILVVAIDGDCSREGTLYCDQYGKSEVCCGNICESAESAYDCYFQRISTDFFCCEYRNQEHPIIDDVEIEERSNFLQNTIKSWLQMATDTYPDYLIIAVPTDAIENWLVCAVEGEQVEGRAIESYTNTFRNHILRNADLYRIDPSQDSSDIKNRLAVQYAGQICKRWGMVINACKQAHAFNDRLFQCYNLFEEARRRS